MQKRILSLLTALTLVFTAFTTLAAIPENGGAGTQLPFRSVLNDEGQGSTTTLTDETFGTIYRMTNSGGTYYRPNIEFTKIKDLSYAAGEYLYVSFYWRAQSGGAPATYFNTETAFEKWGAPTVSVGTSTTMNYDNWNKYEAVLPNNTTRTWTNMRLRIQFGGADSTARSIDIANPVCYYLGAATGTDSAAILSEFRDTFSNDSSIASLTIKGAAIDLSQNPTSYDAGAVGITAGDILLTPTNSKAFVIKEKVEDGLYKVTVLSQKGNIISPNASTSTEYYISYSGESLEHAIPDNDGKGTRLPFLGITQSEGQGSTAQVDDETFGTIYRMTNSGYTYYRPYFDFSKVKGVMYSAGDSLYISFYWRAHDGSAPATYFNLATGFEQWGAPGQSVGTAATMNYGNWNKYEAILTNATNRDWTDMRLVLQFGGADSTDRVIDIAAPLCYYLGAVTVSAETAINAIYHTFEESPTLTSLIVGTSAVDLEQNPQSCTVLSDSAEISCEADGIITVVKAADVYTIKTYSFKDNILTEAAKSTYALTVKKPWDISTVAFYKNGAEVNDFSAFGAGLYSFKMDIENNLPDSFPYCVILAAYDADDRLIGCGIDASEAATGTIKHPEPEVSLSSAAVKFKVFMFERAMSLKPYKTNVLIDTNGIN